MERLFRRKNLIILLVSLFSTSIHAAQRVNLHALSLPELQQLIQVSLPDMPQTVIPSQDKLQLISQHRDAQQVNHLRMQQYYAGYRVFGGYAILHRAKKTAINGVLYRDLTQELGQPDSTFVSQAHSILERFKSNYPSQSIQSEAVEPMVYIDDQSRAHWAYKVSLFIQPNNALPERPQAIIDAKTGDSLLTWNEIKTARSLVKGEGYGGNQRVGKYQYGQNKPLLDISRDEFSGVCYMENNQVRVVDMTGGYLHNNFPMVFDCPTEEETYWTGHLADGYDYQNGSYSPSNDALYMGNVIKQMYKEIYGIEVLTHDGSQPMQLIMRVHYGQNYENAFWDGKQMTFGDGNNFTHSLATLTIGAHEVSHGFTEQNSDLIYVGQSGGINESFSDMAAQAIEYFVKGKCSWLIGADVLKQHGALRFMDLPSRDGRSINNAEQYRKGLDVHYSSGVYNRLYYLLANRPGWNPQQAFKVMVKANMDYWTPYVNFEQGACGIIYAAEDLNFPVSDVKYALEDVSVDYGEC